MNSLTPSTKIPPECLAELEALKREDAALSRDAATSDYITPSVVCFILPRECARDNSFASGAATYLTAKAAADLGNPIPLQDWYMQERAMFYDPQLTARPIQITVGSYDPNEMIPDEHSRNMSVDCQKDETKDTVGTFWFEAAAFDKYGNGRQIARGFAKSWEELFDVQKKFKIPNDRVVIDGAKWTPQVYQMVASHYEVVDRIFLGRPIRHYSTWRIYFGDHRRSFKHPDGQMRSWTHPKPEPMIVHGTDGKRITIKLMTWRWSNLAFEHQLAAILNGMPGMPKYTTLDRKQLSPTTQAKEIGDFTYEKQVSAAYWAIVKGKEVYEKSNKQNHYRDTRLMLLVRMSQDGLIGHVAEVEGRLPTGTGEENPKADQSKAEVIA